MAPKKRTAKPAPAASSAAQPAPVAGIAAEPSPAARATAEAKAAARTKAAEAAAAAAAAQAAAKKAAEDAKKAEAEAAAADEADEEALSVQASLAAFGKDTKPYSLVTAKNEFKAGGVEGGRAYIRKHWLRTDTRFIKFCVGGGQRNEPYIFVSDKNVHSLMPDGIAIAGDGETKKVNAYSEVLKPLPIVKLQMAPNKPLVWEEEGQLMLNTFKGWLHPLEPQEEMSPEREQLIKPWLDLLCFAWAQNNQQHYEFLVRWFARAAKGMKNETVIFIRSPPGTGKGTIIDMLLKYALGAHAVLVTNGVGVVIDKFNQELDGPLIIVLNEAPTAGKPGYSQLGERMKAFGTDPKIRIEPKGREVYYIDNLLNFCFFSQHEALPFESRDRRIYRVDMDDSRAGDAEYWRSLYASFNMESGKALWEYLRSYDLGDHEDRYPPMTHSKAAATMSRAAKFLKEKFIANGDGLARIPSDLLYKMYATWSKERYDNGRPDRKQFIDDLKALTITQSRMGPKKEDGTIDTDRRVNHFKEMSYEELASLFARLGYVDENDDIEVPGGLPEGPLLSPGPQLAKQLATVKKVVVVEKVEKVEKVEHSVTVSRGDAKITMTQPGEISEKNVEELCVILSQALGEEINAPAEDDQDCELLDPPVPFELPASTPAPAAAAKPKTSGAKPPAPVRMLVEKKDMAAVIGKIKAKPKPLSPKQQKLAKKAESEPLSAEEIDAMIEGDDGAKEALRLAKERDADPDAAMHG